MESGGKYGKGEEGVERMKIFEKEDKYVKRGK